MRGEVLRGRAWIHGGFHDDTLITINEDRITDVTFGAASDVPAVDGVIIPGLIDVHVHGGAGADFMDATRTAAEKIAMFHAQHGTCALAATTLSASEEAIARAVRAIAEEAARPSGRSAEIAGIHLEGPFINIDKSGAQDRASIRPANLHELEGWLALAPQLRWMMTVAPEIEGVKALLSKFRHDVLFAIGHTQATYADALDAVQNGARHFTHLFNAMPPFHHRDPGVVGAALISPECTAELIADGVHVHPVVLQTMARMMPDRVVLVTDAMRAAGMADGTYKLHQYEVTVSDGVVRLADGALAGSTLTMIEAVRNMVELAGLPLEHTLPLATEVPARLLRLEKRKGRIEIGYDADLLVLSPRLEIRKIFLRGQEIRPA